MIRGLNKITLYEGKGFFFRYDSDGTIGQVQTTGQKITFNNCDSPKLITEIFRRNNENFYDRQLNIEVREKENYSTAEAILTNYYGWYALIEYNINNEILILDPFVLIETNENYQQGVNYVLNLEHYTSSNKKGIVYNNKNFLTVDSDLITVDSDLITIDQTLL